MSVASDEVRCPDCGYTEQDARELMDHRLCSGYGFFNGEWQVDRSERPKDVEGNPIVMGPWYWWRSRIGQTVGVGKFACNIGKDNLTFFINGRGYRPESDDAYAKADEPSWRG